MNFKNVLEFTVSKKRIILDYFNYSLFDLLAVIIPIIIIPLLVDVFGKIGYGDIVLARAFSGIAGVFVDFGYKNVGSKNIAGRKNNIAFFNSSLTIKLSIFVLLGIIYGLLCYNFSESPLFYFCFYLLNLQSILIPNFLYVGLGKFKVLTKIGFVVSLIQVVLFFTLIYKFKLLVIVPLIYVTSYLIGGIYSYIELKKINKNYFKLVKYKNTYLILKENLVYIKKNSLGIVKDRLSYVIIGEFISKSSLLEFDLGMKFINLLARPVSIYSNVLIRKSVKMNTNRNFFFKQLGLVVVVSFLFLVLFNLVLPLIIHYTINEPIEISILHILSISAIFLNITSFTNSNGLLVFNKSKDIFKGMFIATVSYLSILLILFQFNFMRPIYVVVIATICTYFIESLYALWKIKIN